MGREHWTETRENKAGDLLLEKGGKSCVFLVALWHVNVRSVYIFGPLTNDTRECHVR